MYNKEQFFKEIELVAKQCEYENIQISKSKIRLELDKITGLVLFIEIDENDTILFYFIIRTSSWTYNGDRTDIHDIFSGLFSAFLKTFDDEISCSLFDIPNPLSSQGIFIDDIEIYGRYIIPTQVKNNSTKLDFDSINIFSELINSILFWKYNFWQAIGCPCNQCRIEINPLYEYDIEINSQLVESISNTLSYTENYNQMSRYLPTWQYYKDFDKMISIVESNKLVDFYKTLISSSKNEYLNFKGTNGMIYKGNGLCHYIDNSTFDIAEKLFLSLENVKTNIKYIVIENMVFAFGIKYILFIEQKGGLFEFKKEKNIIFERNKKETFNLFPVTNFIWNEKINPDLFESLVKDLLELEQNTIRVRKVAPLNQPDGGRDLILEWKDIDEGKINKEGDSPYITKKIIVQCKAYNKSVGKSSVKDIRDTTDNYNYDGYFLIVSNQITTPLTDYLDKLRNRGLWIDWWNRTEIEERLNQNQELLHKYKDIVQVNT